MALPKNKEAYISQGAKTAVEDWLKTKIYGRRVEADSKYTLKGKEVEHYAIGILGELHNWFYTKNEQTLENDFLIGTPDIIEENEIIDIKCPWDFSTFPLFDKSPKIDYFYQLQGYMWLTGRKKGRVIYLLLDAPDHLIEREIANALRNANCLRDEAIEERVKKQLTYDGVDWKYRVKEFTIEYDEAVIEVIKERVNACKRYAIELMNEL